MSKKRLRAIATVVLSVLLTVQVPLVAENDDEKTPDEHTPVPYTKEEFPLWQRELRRFEILSFGSLPFVTLLSFWSYDMIRSAQHPNNPGYYPWPFKQADRTIPLTEHEQLGVFLTSVGISMGVALIDIIYRAVKRSAERKRLERENAFTEDPIQFVPAAQTGNSLSEEAKPEIQQNENLTEGAEPVDAPVPESSDSISKHAEAAP